MKWVLGVILVSAAVSIFFVLRWGIQPKTVQIIDLSRARSMDQVGQLMRQTLDMTVMGAPVVVLAVRSPADSQLHWIENFAKSSHGEYVVVTDRDPPWENLRATLKTQSQRLLIVRNPDDVSGPSPFRKKLEVELGTKPIYFITTNMDDPGECVDQLPIFNLDSERFRACAAAAFRRKVAKKKLVKEPFLFAVERFGAQVFVTFLRIPVTDRK